MECAKKVALVCSGEFYAGDKTCKECRKHLVRQNRAKNADYYREYDKKRFLIDPRVSARHKRYQKSESGMAAMKRAKDKWSAQHPIKRLASHMVNNAVRDGRLHKDYECSECGKTGRIHGHHDDYAYPLVVRWLCAKCHTEWHKENGEGLNA